MNLCLFGACFCGGEYFIRFFISKSLLKCLFAEVLKVKKANHHVFVWLTYNKFWVVNELAQGIILQGGDVGEGDLSEF